MARILAARAAASRKALELHPAERDGPPPAEANVVLSDNPDFYQASATPDTVVYGKAGADLLLGGSGADVLFGDLGADVIAAGVGNDFVHGGAGDDRLDGGDGTDTLAYNGHARGVRVDLAAGYALGGGYDRIAGFERVIGSDFADEFLGAGGAETLEGGEGADILDGRGGNDILIGGMGADTQTGGAGADIFVFSAGHGQDIVTDFAAGDLLRIHGYTAYQSLQQSGTSAIVSLAGGETITLLNTNVASLTAASFEFHASVLPITPLAAPTATGPLTTVTADLSIQQGDGVSVTVQGLRFSNPSYGLGPTLFNAGTIAGTHDQSFVGIILESLTPGAAIYNQATGVIAFANTQNHTGTEVYGILSYSNFDTPDFFNAGILTVTATVGIARGIQAGDTGGFNIVNSGEIHVDGGSGANGVATSGPLFNSGLIEVTSDTFARAIELNAYQITFVNSGTVTVEAGSPGGAVAVAYSFWNQGPNYIYNTGLISGDVAIRQGVTVSASSYEAQDYIYNSGAIVGDISTWRGQTRIYNWGSIDGEVDLGLENDLYDGRAGTLVGTVLGGEGDDVLLGGSGSDSLDGGDGVDRVSGGKGVDTVTGGAGADFFHYEAGDGADTLADFSVSGGDVIEIVGYSTYQSMVQQGADVLLTLSGADSILIKNVQLSALTSSDFQFSAAALAPMIAMPALPTPPAAPAPPTLDEIVPAAPVFGDDAANVLLGTSARDTFLAGGGGDTLTGGRGDDLMVGGAGADLFAFNIGDGDDVVFDFDGAAGDRLRVNGLSDVGMVQQGPDVLMLVAGVGSVLLAGTTYAEVTEALIYGIVGTAGADDIVVATSLTNWVEGFGGNDILRGSSGTDILDGGDGNDTLAGLAGSDTMIGGAGSDTLDYGSSWAAVTVSLAITGAQYTGEATGTDTVSEVENISGSSSADNLTGSSGANSLFGLEANDTLYGLGGADFLDGGAFNDTLDGGDGDDILAGGLGIDTLIGGAGIDKADYRAAGAAVNVSLAITVLQNTGGAGTDILSGIEHLLGSAYNDSLFGDVSANTIDGKAGNDSLRGDAGGDILIGGLGADVLDGGDALDYASYVNATTAVGVNLTTGVHTGEAAGDIFIDLERFRLSSHADTFTGDANTNYAYGAEGNDTLNGAGGIDRLYGQADNDTLNGDAGNDILLGGAGADVHNGGADRDTASYEQSTVAITINLTTGVHTGDATGDTWNSVEILWLTAYNDTFTGGANADEVRGAAGVDTMNGAAGNDILRGEAGNDILNGQDNDDFLHGGVGADQLNGGNGVDTAVYLLATGAVTINLTTGTHAGEAAGDSFTSIERFQLSNGFTFADSFTGSAGNDWVAGYKGNDTLNGMDGDDTLNGGEHHDTLNGGNGADKLIAGIGNDTLTGGTGSDQFHFNVGLFGADTITDFENGVDFIRITGQAGIDNISDLTITQNGAHVLITLPDGSTITVQNTLTSAIDASDFLWI